MKSNEYDIRKAVVCELFNEGLTRESIRLEIPLDTGSHGGRADVVVMALGKIGCIELKSGKDTYCESRIKEQTDQYRRAFDACITCVDLSHKKEARIEKDRGIYVESNWRSVDLEYNHDAGRIHYRTLMNEPISQGMFRYKGYETSIYDMTRLLWVSEICAIAGTKTTKHAFTQHQREHGTLHAMRPKVIAALRKRPLNDWERKFWDQFDEENRRALGCSTKQQGKGGNDDAAETRPGEPA